MRLVQDVIRQRGMMALLIEHDMDIIFSVADRIAVMHKGVLVANGTPGAIRADRKVHAIYLGESFDA
jgi:branched-chain amino acid transport system ATP-binding protein